MNNAENFPVDVEAEREWLNAHKLQTGASWTALSAELAVPAGTLSTWATGKYQGRPEPSARAVFRFRQLLESQTERSQGVLVEPGYFETPTSRRITGLLVYAHMGRITVGATGPGTGKDMAANEYAASVSGVTIVTMPPTDEKVSAMIARVLRSLSVDPKGRIRDMSQQVIDQLRQPRRLLIINEANHLEAKALEELRAWHDETRAGICLLGNEELLMRIEGGAKRDAYARLNSRIAQRVIQNLPEAGDVVAFCDAWGLVDPAMRSMLMTIALTPGAGGLRECRQIVEQASMLAADDNRKLTFADLRDAQSTRATRYIRI